MMLRAKMFTVAAGACTVAPLVSSGFGCTLAPPTYEGPTNDSGDPDGGSSSEGGAGTGGDASTGGTVGSGGSGNSGTGGTPGPVEEGLVALYTFDEGSGSIVHDTSGGDAALDLTIGDIAAVEWSPGALHVNASTLIASDGPASKIIDGCLESNELSMETWIAPLQLNQAGPARIVTLSVDPATRDFTLGQQNDLYYVFRLRSEETNLQGQPELQTPSGDLDVKTVLTHIVLTRTALGERAIYVNGELRATDEVGGSFINWDTNYEFALANELTGDRPWLGALHHVAIYSRSLTDQEVLSRYEAGVP
jgi:hypothetical protein